MDELVVTTVVYAPPEDVYDFLVDFPRYANYSEHLKDVRQSGDGSPGTRYALHFTWWKLSYTAHSEVTGVDSPERIDWRIVKDLNAEGCWRVEELDHLPADAPDDATVACRVSLEIEFAPDSVGEDTVDLPRFVSLSWVVEKVKPIVEREARRVVERVVADLEGRRRRVDLDVTRRRDE